MHYKNQIPHESTETLDLIALEKKVENLSQISDNELKNSII